MSEMGRRRIMCMIVLLCSPCCVVGGEREVVMLRSILLGSITGSASALLCACLLSFIFRYIKRLPILNGPVVFSPRISPKSLQSALLANQTQTQTQIILTDNNNNTTLAVKKLHPRGSLNRRRIQRELQILATLNHRHLMSLMAYVAEADRFYLVYEYQNTTTTLEEIQNHLQWDARLRIAVGVIKALQYLHFGCTPRLLHYDLRPSNVFLDADSEPRLGGCGLANIFDGISSPEAAAAAAYYAPECFPNFSIYTDKSDIYSFGVILGMLLTGRDPREALFREVGGMGMWFRQVVEAGDGREALDKSLLGEEMEEDEMLMAVRIAAVCLSDIPLDRPSSDELVPMLTQLHSF